MSKILSLEVENIKKVKVIKINPDPTMNILSGKNGNGKSSTLDSIEMVLGGASFIPDMPVRIGEETARIFLETEEIKATRHWTSPDKSYLKVEAKGMGKIQDAQSLLSALVGDLSFDPLEFSTMVPKNRLKILKEITKLDFTELDKEYKEKFEERTGVKKEYEAFKTSVESFKVNELTKPEFDIKDIKFKREEAVKHNSEIDKIVEIKIPDLEKYIATKEKEIAEKGARISKLNIEIGELEAQQKESKDFIMKSFDTIEELKTIHSNSKKVNSDDFDKMITEHSAYESALETAKQREEIIKKRDSKQTKSTELTDRLDEIITEREKLLSNAKMPIDGLSFGDGDVSFNGLPFLQLSTSEQIQVSMAIAMALNPRLKIIIIKNGSLLDSDAMKKIYTIAQEKDFQVWVEKVSDSPDGNSLFIEDGEIKKEESEAHSE